MVAFKCESQHSHFPAGRWITFWLYVLEKFCLLVQLPCQKFLAFQSKRASKWKHPVMNYHLQYFGTGLKEVALIAQVNWRLSDLKVFFTPPNLFYLKMKKKSFISPLFAMLIDLNCWTQLMNKENLISGVLINGCVEQVPSFLKGPFCLPILPLDLSVFNCSRVLVWNRTGQTSRQERRFSCGRAVLQLPPQIRCVCTTIQSAEVSVEFGGGGIKWLQPSSSLLPFRICFLLERSPDACNTGFRSFWFRDGLAKGCNQSWC